MAGNTEIYSKAEIYADGNFLTEVTNVSVSFATNAVPVRTIAKGFSGVTPGSAEVTISVDSQVPSSDFEFNPGEAAMKLQPVEMWCFGAGRTLKVKGFITDWSFTHSEGASAQLTFNFMGSPVAFE